MRYPQSIENTTCSPVDASFGIVHVDTVDSFFDFFVDSLFGIVDTVDSLFDFSADARPFGIVDTVDSFFDIADFLFAIVDTVDSFFDFVDSPFDVGVGTPLDQMTEE